MKYEDNYRDELCGSCGETIEECNRLQEQREREEQGR